jgi:SAM-dependent methyltransferase
LLAAGHANVRVVRRRDGPQATRKLARHGRIPSRRRCTCKRVIAALVTPVALVATGSTQVKSTARDDRAVMDEPKAWMAIVAENPGHSRWYIERFRSMAAAGHDLHGEARFVDAMARRNARILDAGCGPGRVAGRLHELGHDVVGVDIDPALITAAEADHPGPRWIVGDLATVDVAPAAAEPGFDVIVSAGNVMPFVEPTSRRAVLANLARMLAADGRLAVGFGANRGYGFDEFDADATAAGLSFDLRLATWELHPWTPQSDFLVAVLRRSR